MNVLRSTVYNGTHSSTIFIQQLLQWQQAACAQLHITNYSLLFIQVCAQGPEYCWIMCTLTQEPFDKVNTLLCIFVSPGY